MRRHLDSFYWRGAAQLVSKYLSLAKKLANEETFKTSKLILIKLETIERGTREEGAAAFKALKLIETMFAGDTMVVYKLRGKIPGAAPSVSPEFESAFNYYLKQLEGK